MPKTQAASEFESSDTMNGPGLYPYTPGPTRQVMITPLSYEVGQSLSCALSDTAPAG